MLSPERHPLRPGRQRWRHGPIDLVVGADGDPGAVAIAHAAAWDRFVTVLDELVGELPVLRGAVDPGAGCPLRGPVARRMWAACEPHAAGGAFITSMAAVAGAVADELIASYRQDGIDRAWVNNGGDIALHVGPGRRLRIGLVADLARVAAAAPPLDASFAVEAASPVRGVATSGWRGRSFSLGIADSVTVLARSAAEADAAATIVANAVDVDDARVVRVPADRLKDDTDLGSRPVTVDVPPLEPARVERALTAGVAVAEDLRRRGWVEAVLLVCQERARTVGGPIPAWIDRASGAPVSAGSELA